MRRIIDNSCSPEKKRPHIGHYGHLRKAYLEGYRPDLYAALIVSEQLYEHCAEIEDAARSRLDIIILMRRRLFTSHFSVMMIQEYIGELRL